MSRIVKYSGSALSLVAAPTALPAPPATLTTSIVGGLSGLKGLTFFLNFVTNGTSRPQFNYSFQEFDPNLGSKGQYILFDASATAAVQFSNDIRLDLLGAGIQQVTFELNNKPVGATELIINILEVGDPLNPGTINSLYCIGSVN